MQAALFWSATTLYAFATAMYILWLSFRKDWAKNWGFGLSLLGAFPHGAAIVLRWIEVGHGPYNTRYEVLSSCAFALVAGYLVLASQIKNMQGLGIVVLPASFLQMGLASASFGVKKEVPIIFKSYWLLLHIGFAKAFFATIALAAACATIYLIKARNPARLTQFPVKEKLDLYSYQFLLASFLFLGIMIVAGALWAHQSWGRYWGWDPIETSSFVTWVAYGIILHFRVLHGWSGARMAWLTNLALGFAVMTLYVVTIMVPTIHNSFMVGK